MAPHNHTLNRSVAERMRGKLAGLQLRSARGLYRALPEPVRHSGPGRAYACWLYRLVCRVDRRRSYVATFFLRNRPELELLGRLIETRPYGSPLHLCVLACSKGAEVYSMAWAIRSKRPDLQLSIEAVDIDAEMVRFAEAGVYSLDSLPSGDPRQAQATAQADEIGRHTARDQGASLFERMTAEEIEAMFEIRGNTAHIRPSIREGISWRCGDACDPSLASSLGAQDIVVANRFLCHIGPEASAGCLRNIAALIRPGGHLFVCGVDLEVRSAAARELGWTPVTELIREIHEGDPSIRAGWPLEYWGLEPLDESVPDWKLRYASVFRAGMAAAESDACSKVESFAGQE